MKIITGNNGYILVINGLYLRKDINLGYGIIALKSKFGATEFSTIQALRDFWHNYREIIVNAAIKMPYIWANTGFVRDFGYTDIKQTDSVIAAKNFLSVKYGLDYKGSQLTDAEIDYFQDLKAAERKYNYNFK